MSNLLLTEESLEELYGNVSNNIIIEVAKEQNFRLPENLREEEEDISYEVHAAIDVADYALECQEQAQQSMNDSSNVNFIDMMTKDFFTSLWKYTALSEADVDMQQVQNALSGLNAELRGLANNKRIQLKYGRLATAIDDGFLDALTHLQINEAQKRISKAITQVENIEGDTIGAEKK